MHIFVAVFLGLEVFRVTHPKVFLEFLHPQLLFGLQWIKAIHVLVVSREEKYSNNINYQVITLTDIKLCKQIGTKWGNSFSMIGRWARIIKSNRFFLSEVLAAYQWLEYTELQTSRLWKFQISYSLTIVFFIYISFYTLVPKYIYKHRVNYLIQRIKIQ